MEFFKEMRIFFVFFISLGFWTTWQNGEFKFLLRLCSAFSMVLKFLFFSSAIIFDKLYGFDSLSNTVANVLFVFSALTHFVIVLETIFSDEAQKKLIQQLSAVDHLLTTKLQMKITYQHEKRTIFIHMLILASSKILTNVIIVIYYLYQNRDYSFLYPGMYSTIVICLRLIQVWFFVYLVQARLYLINIKLNEVQRLLQPTELISSVSEYSSYDEILSLKQTYSELNDICRQISLTFGWSLLIIITHMFAKSTVYFYWMFRNLPEFDSFFINFCSVVPYLLILGTLAYHCSACSYQVGFPNGVIITHKNHIDIEQCYFNRFGSWKGVSIESQATIYNDLKLI